jgi:hypothetical protein
MKKSDKTLILEHLKANGYITPMDALRFGCYRLSARIYDLRRDGYNIITDDKDAEGNPVNYAIYRIKEDNHE